MPDDIDVLFLLSVPNSLKEMLLKSARLLIYTPSNEHFGIVPLEAMLAGLPVLAANTGGPLETVVEGKTGWLRSPDEPEHWTEVMNMILHKMSTTDTNKMGEAGKARVQREFSDVKMAERFDEILTDMRDVERRSVRGMTFFFGGIAIAILDILYSISVLYSKSIELSSKKKLPPFALSALALFSAVAYVVVDYGGAKDYKSGPRPKSLEKKKE